jgi:hypothetical protein
MIRSAFFKLKELLKRSGKLQEAENLIKEFPNLHNVVEEGQVDSVAFDMPFQQNRCASKIGFLTLQKQILHVQNRNFTRFCSKIRKFPILRAKMEFLTDCA